MDYSHSFTHKLAPHTLDFFVLRWRRQRHQPSLCSFCFSCLYRNANAMACVALSDSEYLVLLESKADKHPDGVIQVLKHLSGMIEKEVARCDAADTDALRAMATGPHPIKDALHIATQLPMDVCQIAAMYAFEPARRTYLRFLYRKRGCWQLIRLQPLPLVGISW